MARPAVSTKDTIARLSASLGPLGPTRRTSRQGRATEHNGETYLDLPAVSKLIERSMSTVYQLIAKKTLRTYTLRGRRMVKRSAVEAYLKAREASSTEDTYVSRADAAALLRVTTRTLDRLKASGALQAYRHDGGTYYRRKDLEEYARVRATSYVQLPLPGMEYLGTDPAEVVLTDAQASAVARVYDDIATRKRPRRTA